ncbi:unnamed protein product [Brassica napus]|uniref:(rape) hypothetical protein n=1 Tax=Brassica napus TaxID=3708 RepID=A0A816XMQ3_BRANA|nr:unnamed protein product [Brassica napus]
MISKSYIICSCIHNLFRTFLIFSSECRSLRASTLVNPPLGFIPIF